MMTLTFAGLLIALSFWFFMAYNRMVEVRNRVTNAFAQIDVQLKRRHDLIPNLVETAKAYMAHESGTLQAVIKARNSASSANGGELDTLHPGMPMPVAMYLSIKRASIASSHDELTTNRLILIVAPSSVIFT